VKARRLIRAELASDDRATACGIVARSSSPVLRLCRLLVEAGHHPGLPLEAWRNGVLCLRVRSIGEAAGLEINAHGTGFISSCARRAAPPIDLNASDHPKTPDGNLWRDWPPHEGG
jgi:hypothetical protein